ncbi:acetyl-CoA hydrolase/transferase C-terminal domain-containing protein [Paraburkholderia phymatum]|uniref:acetyl-CoA hydrolase/transferase family protein n=1 Tax=Paraburkholderia phymatum TaxID=148447 RepID=UPI00316E2970
MRRIRSLAQIAGLLPQRPTLVLHSACSEPIVLAGMLAREAAAFKGARVLSLMPMGAAPYGDPPATDHLSVMTFFPGKGLRSAATARRAEALRYSLSDIPGLFERNEFKADALLLQVSPPDARNRVSLGLSVDYMQAVLLQKPLVIAEINPQLPRTCGDAAIDAGLIDYFIDATSPPQTVPRATGDAIDRCIARNVAALIDDGAVLQVGIGSLPDQVLGCLTDRRHLGLHSGIITEAAQPLIESRVLDNSTKSFFRGISVATMAAGTQAFYDFIDDNPLIELHSCSITHGASVLAAIDGLTAINSALQIDLAGRVNAEAVGGRIVAAPGGLPDFSRGARRAPRGRSILALRSRYKESSNILPRLPSDVPVTIEADDVDFVVTEFGVAALRGCSPIARAEAFISVAHPADQAELQRVLSLGTVT